MLHIELLIMDARLQCPFTMLVVGPSGSGKSVFTRKLIQHAQSVLVDPPQRVVWCYGASGAVQYNDGIEYHQGLPTDDLIACGRPMLLVIDDLMQEATSSAIVSDIFTKYSHHNNITCICLMQNLFPRGCEMRNISLNANYIVLMKNSRDRAQINHLARQMFPGRSACLTAAYEDATKDAYGYLMLDCRNTTPDELRARSGLFPGDALWAYQFPKVYKDRRG